jgi:hypothetical protein
VSASSGGAERTTTDTHGFESVGIGLRATTMLRLRDMYRDVRSIQNLLDPPITRDHSIDMRTHMESARWRGFAVTLCTTSLLAAPAAGEFIAYVSSLVEDSIVRLRDLNGDGDRHDSGEATLFFGPGNESGWPGVGSAQTILVLGVDHVLAADGEESGGFSTRVYELRDLNGDGDAMDAGEATEYWDSILPIGVNVDRPKEMVIGPDGAIYLADNNTINFDGDTPEAVWRLEDLNADGDVNDDGEVTLHVELAPAGEAFAFICEDFKYDDAGRLFFSNAESSSNAGTVFIIEPDLTVRQFASNDDLFGIYMKETGMTLQPASQNPVLAAEDVFGNVRIVELIDSNGNGVIDDNEERYDWYRSDLAVDPVFWDINVALDVDYTPDGSLWLLEVNDPSYPVYRFEDLNSDGDFNDAGETGVLYDAIEAQNAGSFVMTFPRTVGFAALAPLGDLTGDGTVNVFDLLALLEAWGDCPDPPAECPADLNGDGTVNVFDLLMLLDNWG